MSKTEMKRFHELACQLLEQYRVVDQIVNQTHSTLESTPMIESLEVIKRLLDQVKDTESQLQPKRESLINAGESVPTDTQVVIDETVKIVTTLIPRIGDLEKQAISARKDLAPKIKESVRAAKMQSAYSRVSS